MKSSNKIEQVSVRKTNANKPSENCRYEFRCRLNQACLVILGQFRRMPDDWADGDRRRGGVSRMQAFAWNCRNQISDVKGEAQAAEKVTRAYRCRDLGRTDP
jgi:hypothetical protein